MHAFSVEGNWAEGAFSSYGYKSFPSMLKARIECVVNLDQAIAVLSLALSALGLTLSIITFLR
jgi:hypothetical protein